MKMRTICLMILLALVISGYSWGVVVVRRDDTLYTSTSSSAALDTAFQMANDSAAVGRPVDHIYINGGNPSNPYYSNADNFVLTSDVSNLDVIFQNEVHLEDQVNIFGENIHFYAAPAHDCTMFVETDDDFGFLIDSSAVVILEDLYVKSDSIGINAPSSDSLIVKYSKIDSCDYDGIRTSAKCTELYKVIINDCPDYGIYSYDADEGGRHTITILKTLVNNASYGIYYEDLIKGSIDRTTVANFDDYGIRNDNTDSTSITCKRTLTHTTDTSAYHFWKVKLINAWTGNNDNVAMGGDCNTYSRDFYSCDGSASYALSYDDLTTNYSAPILGEFKPDESNIVLQSSYTDFYWSWGTMGMDHPAKRLAYYTHSGNWYYADNIGYDTLISSSLGKEVLTINTISMIEMADLNCYPNPFRSSINIDAEPNSVNFIYDYNGRLIKEFSGTANWKPEENVIPGVYLIKTKTTGKKDNIKKIYYLK